MNVIFKVKIGSALKLITVLLLTACLISGCAKTEHLSDISIVEGMSIDHTEKGFEITVQTLNLAKSGSISEGISGNVTMNISGQGENISRAIDNAAEGLSKKTFLWAKQNCCFRKRNQ